MSHIDELAAYIGFALSIVAIARIFKLEREVEELKNQGITNKS